MAPLPAGQRSALARALVLEEVEGPPPDAHAAGVAVLNALRGLATTRDVLVAVDDVQWLDAASAAALAYAARRLRSEHVGVLLACRTGVDSVLVGELRRVPRCGDVRVGSLEPSALHDVVHEHLAIALPRPLLAEVHQASGGNPFYALEIVRMLQRSEMSVEAGRPLPVPDSLHDLVHARLSRLAAGEPRLPDRGSRARPSDDLDHGDRVGREAHRRAPAGAARPGSSRPTATASASPTRCSWPARWKPPTR